MKNFMQVILDNWDVMFDGSKKIAFQSVSDHLLKIEAENKALEIQNAAMKNQIEMMKSRYVNIK